MKICHVITRFILGGAQENTLATVTGLATRGHDVTLITGPSRGREGRLLDYAHQGEQRLPFRLIEDARLVRPIHPWHDFLAYRNLAAHFEREEYDIVHTHSSKAGILGRAAARDVRRRGITRVVHTIHGLAFDEFQPAWKNKLFVTAERWCASHTDALVSVCDAMTQQALAARVGRPEQFTTIHSGIDLALFRQAREQRDEMRRSIRAGGNTVVLLSIGRLFPMKGAEDFLTVLGAVMRTCRTPVKGVLVGDGPLRSCLEERARKMLPAGSVVFTGLIPPGDVPQWMAAADGIVHASLREGLARAPVQALATGTPVFTYDIGGVREVVKHGINGCVCEPADVAELTKCVVGFVDEPARREKLTNGALGTSLDDFSTEVMVRKLSELYSQQFENRKSKLVLRRAGHKEITDQAHKQNGRNQARNDRYDQPLPVGKKPDNREHDASKEEAHNES